jgi:selenocysteine-specific elongation factor
MKKLIIGTAGHIDHGKTALIKALTGFDGDQTQQEKDRGITMDLSFTWLDSGEDRIAFIDVPGHEKLVKNMIAGAFGFDYVLLIVAADDGVMPQTLEHLGVVDTLGIPEAIVAITKADKVDAAQLERVQVQIEAAFKKCHQITLLDMVPTSIHESASIEALKARLFSLPARPKKSAGFFRYYIDRVFSAKGTGVVVTGTVLDGSVKEKEKLHLCDRDKPVTVRSIQVHGNGVPEAHTGERAALNLSGVSHNDLGRGMLLSKKGFLRGFNTIDTYAYALEGQKLRHNSTVQLFWGSARAEAKLLFLEGTGEADEAFVQLHTLRPVFAVYGDAFVIRSDDTTIGGGQVLGPIGDPMRKAQKKAYLQALHAGRVAEAFEILVQAHPKGFGLISSNQRFGLDHDAALAAAKRLSGCFVDEKDLVVYHATSRRLLQEAALAIYEKNRRALLSSTTLAQRFKWASRAFVESALSELLEEGSLMLEGGLYRHPACDVRDAQGYIEDTLMKIIDEAGLAPDAPYNLYDSLDLDRKGGDDALKSLTAQNKVIRLAHNLFISATNLQRAMETLREIIRKDGFAEVQNVKERLGLSRKYVVSYLEYLDRFEDIKRIDNRRLFA